MALKTCNARANWTGALTTAHHSVVRLVMRALTCASWNEISPLEGKFVSQRQLPSLGASNNVFLQFEFIPIRRLDTLFGSCDSLFGNGEPNYIRESVWKQIWKG
jgi:hypothetical protein